MKRSRFLVLPLAAAIAGAAPGLAATARADDLVGAGSTLVAPLMAKWSQDFQSKTGNSVTYGAVGSGAGIAQITARSVDFGASDAPLTKDQAAACNNCVQIPWALTATAIAFNVPGVNHVNLTGPILAQIYLGHITNWNDKSIQKLNHHAKLPNLKITPVFRSDGSGDTYAFTDYLAHSAPNWKNRIGVATSVSFPVGVGGKGNDGVTALVSSTSGSIGYISASYAIAHNLGVAALRNRAKKFLYPNLKNIQAAGAIVKRVPANNEMHIVDPPASAKLAYPLSTFTYAIVPKGAPKKDTIAKFVNYAMTTGQQFGAALDFAPIPKVVLAAGQKTAAAL